MMNQKVEVRTGGSRHNCILILLSVVAFFIVLTLILALVVAVSSCNEAVLGNPSGSPISFMCKAFYA